MAALGKSCIDETSSAPRPWVPRPFNFHWGSGQIIEEASFVGESLEGMRQDLKETPRLRALLKKLVG